MRIGIDARLLDESGVGRYIKNLLFQLSKLDRKNSYFIFLLSKDSNKIPLPRNFKKISANIPWYTMREQTEFPTLLEKYNLDLMHFPHFNVPIKYQGKFIVTIHDLIHQHFAMHRASTHGRLIYFLKQLGYRFVFRSALKKSQKIITVSEYVKEQLMKDWHINNSKIMVTYEAADLKLLTLAKNIQKNQIDQILKKYHIRSPFIFYVGNAHPHKNIAGLITAFLKLKGSYQYLQLVLSGKDHYFWKQIKKRYTHQDIVYTGFISDKELVALYKSAACYVIPSFEEGFGIPLLESFACGCPVAAARIGALEEVGGDACLYFNPKDVQDMASIISRILNENKLRKELVSRGNRRYQQFSWDKLADETLKIYQVV